MKSSYAQIAYFYSVRSSFKRLDGICLYLASFGCLRTVLRELRRFCIYPTKKGVLPSASPVRYVLFIIEQMSHTA